MSTSFNGMMDILVTIHYVNCRPTHTKITLSAMNISIAATLLNMLLTVTKKRRPCL